MGKETVAQHPSKSRRVIEILVLLVIIAGIILVVAELTINVLPVVKGKSSVSVANEILAKPGLDNNFTGSAPITPAETNDTR